MDFIEDNWKTVLAAAIVVLVVIWFINKFVTGASHLFEPSNIVPTTGGKVDTNPMQSPTP